VRNTTLMLSLILLFTTVSALAWEATIVDTFETHWENGNLKERWTATNFTGNEKGFRKDGLYQSWYENGQMSEEGEYVLDVQNGEWITWYEDGMRKEQITYRVGKRHGRHMIWHPDFTLKLEEYYRNDVRQGIYLEQRQGRDLNNYPLLVLEKRFYLNGVPVITEVKDGEWTYIKYIDEFYNKKLDRSIHYDRQKEFIDVGQYVDGEKHGVWTRWNREGEKIFDDVYHHGKMVSD
jgi:antitoxin component YwqK of YwqJK toxin-antitoxin module